MAPAGELSPRAVYRTGGRGWYASPGTSSTRTATEDGDQGAFALAGYRTERATVFAGPFVEFGGRARLVAGCSIEVSRGLSLEPYYDGQFVALAAGWKTGPAKVTVHRSGTGRFGLTMGWAF